jgi:hypothetical protein
MISIVIAARNVVAGKLVGIERQSLFGPAPSIVFDFAPSSSLQATGGAVTM